MTNRAKLVFGVPAIAAVLSACASPGYSPPERPAAAERCPIGEVWVCHDRYPSRLDKEGEPPMICMCQDVRAVR